MSLSLAANPELKIKYLALSLGKFDEECGNLDGWCKEFLKLSKKNVLEVLEMKLTIRADIYGPEASEYCMPWANDMDEILADSGAFPALREVSIDITWYIRDVALGYIAFISGELTRVHFPRLSKSREIRFSLRFKWHGF